MYRIVSNNLYILFVIVVYVTDSHFLVQIVAMLVTNIPLKRILSVTDKHIVIVE